MVVGLESSHEDFHAIIPTQRDAEVEKPWSKTWRFITILHRRWLVVVLEQNLEHHDGFGQPTSGTIIQIELR